MSVRTGYTVEGMTCGHCVQSVSTGLSALPGVTGVEVDLNTGTVQVTSEAPLAQETVGHAVDEAGFTLVGLCG